MIQVFNVIKGPRLVKKGELWSMEHDSSNYWGNTIIIYFIHLQMEIPQSELYYVIVRPSQSRLVCHNKCLCATYFPATFCTLTYMTVISDDHYHPSERGADLGLRYRSVGFKST